MKKFLFTTSLCLITFMSVFAQVGIGTEVPDPSAILEIKSADKGFLPPRLSCTERQAITSPAQGLVVFDTSINNISFFNGVDWVFLTSSETVACDGIAIDTYSMKGSANSSTIGVTNDIRIKTNVTSTGVETATYRDGYIVLNVPKNDQFSTATLRLTVKDKQSGALGDVAISTVDVTGFTETTITWNNQPTVITPDVQTFDATNLAANDILDIDVTALLLAAKTAGDDLLGLRFRFVNTTIDDESVLFFYSKEASDPATFPVLLIQ